MIKIRKVIPLLIKIVLIIFLFSLFLFHIFIIGVVVSDYFIGGEKLPLSSEIFLLLALLFIISISLLILIFSFLKSPLVLSSKLIFKIFFILLVLILIGSFRIDLCDHGEGFSGFNYDYGFIGKILNISYPNVSPNTRNNYYKYEDVLPRIPECWWGRPAYWYAFRLDWLILWLLAFIVYVKIIFFKRKHSFALNKRMNNQNS